MIECKGYISQCMSQNERRKLLKRLRLLSKKGTLLTLSLSKGMSLPKLFGELVLCKHPKTYSIYENRLLRGRTYVRNGFIIDLKLSLGEVKAFHYPLIVALSFYVLCAIMCGYVLEFMLFTLLAKPHLSIEAFLI